MKPTIDIAGAQVFLGDCRDVLKTLPDNSVDSIVTDPPYELNFMQRKWDNTGVAYDVTVWQECLRVLKPGGHVLAFGGSRTWHRLAVAVEDAGFELRDSIAWLYGSGFPKSLDVSKAIDKNNGKHKVDLSPFGSYVKDLRESKGLSRKQLDDVMGTNTAVSWWEGRASGVQLPSKETYERLKIVLGMDGRFDSLIDWAEAEREVIGQRNVPIGHSFASERFGKTTDTKEVDETLPATSEAQKWQGWGTALKPAFEPVVVGRKPLVGTVAENVLAWGVGGLNIDGSRIGTNPGYKYRADKNGTTFHGKQGERIEQTAEKAGKEFLESTQGRWPANVILDEVTAGLLDEQSGENPSRFFYQAKASKRDRNEGLEELEVVQANSTNWSGDGMPVRQDGTERKQPHKQNFHPTVKPTQLMRYLIKLVTPAEGTVLDPFTGSGSTGKAALLDGYKFIGAELTEEYLPIIEGRLAWATRQQHDGTLF